jgi:hypothetical protein
LTIYQQRPTPIPLIWAVRYNPATYEAEDGLPEIEYVPPAWPVPGYGIIHGPEGDIAVSEGDYITVTPGVEGAYPTYGFGGAYPWYEFDANYEPR